MRKNYASHNPSEEASLAMTAEELIDLVRQDPSAVEFEQVMQVIDQYYDYIPTRFLNGDIVNEAGENEGSCKIFAFAQIHQLSELETLALFGKYYREDVLENPTGEDHPNIRNFILDGWLGIRFDLPPLTAKSLQ